MPVTAQRPAGFVHLGLEVADVNAVVSRLRARGVKVGDPSVSARTKSVLRCAWLTANGRVTFLITARNARAGEVACRFMARYIPRQGWIRVH